jgi:hypothetical protein
MENGLSMVLTVNAFPKPFCSSLFNSMTSWLNSFAATIFVLAVIIKDPVPATSWAGYGINGNGTASRAFAVQHEQVKSTASLKKMFFSAKVIIDTYHL